VVRKLPVIKNSFFYKTIAIVIVMLITYTAVVIFTTTTIMNKTVLSIEKSSGKAIVEKIVGLVKNTDQNLSAFKEFEIDSKKQGMENFINSLAFFIQNAIKSAKDKEKAKKEIFDIVSNLKYGQNYCFITDYNSTMLAHPYLRGKNLSKLKDKNGKLIVPSIVKTALSSKNGEGFTEYWWKKNKNDKSVHKKIVYAKNLPQYKFIIGVGIYFDDIDKIVNKRKELLYNRLNKIVLNTKIGKSGYVYIFNDKGYMLFHPNSNIVKTNFKHLKDPETKKSIFEEVVKAAKTTHELKYKWDKPTDKGHYIYEKIAWVYYFPKLKWYIASSAYLSDLNTPILIIKRNILITTLITLLIMLIFTYYAFKKMLSPIQELSVLAQEVTDGNYSIRSNYKGDDEIGVLSREFNKMIDVIEQNIYNLDKQVKSKTKELQDALDYAKLIFNNTVVGIMIVDKNRIIQDINPSLCKLLEYSKEELIGKNTTILHINKEKYYEGGKKLFNPAQEHKIANNVFPLKTKNNEIVWCLVDGSPLKDGSVVWNITDYTQTYLYNKNLNNKNTQLETLLNAQSNMIFIVENHKITIFNQAMSNYFGNQTINDITKDACLFANLFLKQEHCFYYEKNSQKDWIESLLDMDENKRIISLHNKHGKFNIFKVDIKQFETADASYLIQLHDITDMFIETNILKEQATTDVLTGAYNRRGFIEILKNEIKKSKFSNSNLSILMFDIDFFKKINDTYGHDVGDAVLIKLSETIFNNIRKEDIFARWGGEEFIILMPSTQLELATQKAESLRHHIENLDAKDLPKFTVSFGVTVYHEDESIDNFIKRADDALYRSKETGRNKTSANS
jgi:diguanylate cyclase (GGDEF)-like protein/PAS domain S-box-containing protein